MGAIEPINIYGKTKAESEIIIKHTKTGYLLLRPSLILGYSPNTVNDRPFNRLLRNIDKGEPAVYDNSWKFQPTYIGHISEIITSCIGQNIWNQTLPISVLALKSRFDTAYDILTPFGIKVTSIDNHDPSKVIQDKLIELQKYNLPQYTYLAMINKITQEIKDRAKFILE